MSRPSKLLSLAVLVALMATAGFFLLRGERAPGPLGGDPAAAPAPGTGTDGAAADPALPAGPAEREAVRAQSDGPALPADLDPQIRAALAEFRGRVLHHDGEPAAGTRVVLYRGDFTTVIGETLDLLAPESVDPDIDAGEAVTGADGRFSIAGVWPRELYLLHAGVGSDNPTPKIVERTPDAGENVDLGDIYLRDGAIVTGTVLDQQGQPLAGALVRVIDLPAQIMQMVALERFDPEGAIIVRDNRQTLVVGMPPWAKRRFDELPIAAAHTAADGTFRVSGIEPGDNVLVVTARDHCPLTQPNLKLDAGKQKDVGTLRMREGEEVYGKVIDAAGKPVAGAEVLLAQGGAVPQVTFAGPALRTDEKGAFSARGFNNGRIVGAARRDRGAPWVVADPQPALRDLDIVLPAALRLTLRLTNQGEQPIEDPRFRLLPSVPGDGAIELARLGLASEIDVRSRLELLEDGRYRITDLAPGRYTLLVRCPGHALTGQAVELTADLEQTIELEPEAALAVLVQDGEGRPVRSAAIYVDARARDGRRRLGDMPLPAGRTDASGRLFATGIAPGEVRLAARHPAWGTVGTTAQVPGEEVVLSFAAPGAVDGILTDGGQIPDAGKWTISVSRVGGGREHLPDMPRLGVPDAEGKFSIRGLQPGEYRVEAIDSLANLTSAGSLVRTMTGLRAYNYNIPTVVVVAGQTAHVAVDTQNKPLVDGPSAHVTGTVLVNGSPATGMMLTGWGNHGRVTAEVDAAGRFDLGQVTEGHLYLQLFEPDDQLIMRGSMWSKSINVVANQDQAFDIALETAAISGFVTDAQGAAVSGATVRMYGSLKGSKEKGAASADFRALTDERGRFEIPRIPAGSYTVRAEHDDVGLGTATAELSSGMQQVDVRLRPTAVVSGRIDLAVFGAKKPLNIWLTFTPKAAVAGRSSEWAPVDQDGSFEIRKLLPGEYGAQAHVAFANDEGGQQYELDGTLNVDSLRVEGVVLRLRPRELRPAPVQR